MHIAIRHPSAPLRLFRGPDDSTGDTLGSCVMGGVRETAYLKQIGDCGPMVGAMLRPGMADPLSGTPAGALAHRHTRLDDLWRSADLTELRERLAEAPTLDRRLAIFEEVLSRRLPNLRAIDPLVAHALLRLNGATPVADLVAESGFSHRHVVKVFREAVGVSPKTYLRLGRFNRTLHRLHATGTASLADIAAENGFSDQAHMTREFGAIAGVTPGRYRELAPLTLRHVPLAD